MNSDIVTVLTRSEVSKVNKAEIIYVERHSGATVIHTAGKRYLIHVNMRYLTERLSEPFFYKCHSGCIVNFDMLCSVRDNTLYLDGGNCVFLGNAAYQATRRNFIAYLGKNYGLIGDRKWVRNRKNVD